jgi:hypothetical protein
MLTSEIRSFLCCLVLVPSRFDFNVRIEKTSLFGPERPILDIVASGASKANLTRRPSFGILPGQSIKDLATAR